MNEDPTYIEAAPAAASLQNMHPMQMRLWFSQPGRDMGLAFDAYLSLVDPKFNALEFIYHGKDVRISMEGWDFGRLYSVLRHACLRYLIFRDSVYLPYGEYDKQAGKCMVLDEDEMSIQDRTSTLLHSSDSKHSRARDGDAIPEVQATRIEIQTQRVNTLRRRLCTFLVELGPVLDGSCDTRVGVVGNEASGQHMLIHEPHTIQPRRLWDLRSNKVIPYEVALYCIRRSLGRSTPASERQVGYWAISHSWVDVADRVPIKTSINGQQWPVPIPKGVNLERVRAEVRSYGVSYCWLDLLCLRQPGRDEDEEKRLHEWKVDVPTIGNIYRQAKGVLRYFNGLGRKIEATGWDHKRHWLNRAWTLQEIRHEEETFNGGIPRKLLLPLHLKGHYKGKVRQLRELIQPLTQLASDLETTSGCSIIALTQEMKKRVASNPVDKIAGLSYLLRSPQLPVYSETEEEENAWLRCIEVLRDEMRLELLFNFPWPRNQRTCSTIPSWIPTWGQIQKYKAPTVPYSQPESKVCGLDYRLPPNLAGMKVNLVLDTTNTLILSNVVIEPDPDSNAQDQYMVSGQTFKNVGFYSVHARLRIKSGAYMLVSGGLKATSSWLVCKRLGRYENVRFVKKVGVLRTDSGGELAWGVTCHLLPGLRCLEVIDDAWWDELVRKDRDGTYKWQDIPYVENQEPEGADGNINMEIQGGNDDNYYVYNEENAREEPEEIAINHREDVDDPYSGAQIQDVPAERHDAEHVGHTPASPGEPLDEIRLPLYYFV